MSKMRGRGRPKGRGASGGKDPEALADAPPAASAEDAGTYTLSQLQYRFVDTWTAVLKSRAVANAPFVLVFQRGAGSLELPPQLVLEGLLDGNDESILSEHLGDLARALLPIEHYPKLVITIQSLAAEFAAAPAGNELRIFFPLNASNVLLGAYIPPGPRNPAPVRAIWMSSADDGSLASVQHKRIVRVNLPPGSSDTDRMTLALLLLLRVVKISELATLLADPMKEFPDDGDDARKYLTWELLRQPDMQLYLLPPSDNLQAVTMVHDSLSEAYTALGINVPDWFREATFSKEEHQLKALQDSTQSALFVVPLTEKSGGIHRYSWTRSGPQQRLMLVANRANKFLTLLYLFAEQNTLWMATTADAVGSIGSLRVDEQPARFDDRHRHRIAQVLHGAHAIEFCVEEHRIKLMVLYGSPLSSGPASVPVQPAAPLAAELAPPYDDFSQSMEVSQPLAAPPAASLVSAPVKLSRRTASPAATAAAPVAASPAPLPVSVMSPSPTAPAAQSSSSPRSVTSSAAATSSPPPAPAPAAASVAAQSQRATSPSPRSPGRPRATPAAHPPVANGVAEASVAASGIVPEILADANGVTAAPHKTRPKKQKDQLVRKAEEQALRASLENGQPIPMPTATQGWWHTFRSVLMRFSKQKGRLVWFHRETSTSTEWHQRPMDCSMPAGAPDSTLKSWWEWHTSLASKGPPATTDLRDLYYLIDVEVTRDDLDKLEKVMPLFKNIDDGKSCYSLHRYVITVLGEGFALPNLLPRLSFAPGFIPGAISTPLHVDGVGHMTMYHWLLGFDSMGCTLLDIYPGEQELSAERWKRMQEVSGPSLTEWYSQPHQFEHVSNAGKRVGCEKATELEKDGFKAARQIELRPGQLQLIPAGHPSASKKLGTEAAAQPQVTLEGGIAWLGTDITSASASLERMLRVERGLKDKNKKPFCYPEIAMLCCLMLQPETDEDARLQHEHLIAAAPMLRNILDSEISLLNMAGSPAAVPIDEITKQQAWTCYVCDAVMANAIMFCKVREARRAYCLSCWSTAVTIGYDNLDEKRKQQKAPQPSAQVLRPRKGNKRARGLFESEDLEEPEANGDDAYMYDNDDIDDDEEEPDDELHSHTGAWQDRHLHELVFRFGSPPELLASLEQVCLHPRQVQAAGRSERKVSAAARATPAAKGAAVISAPQSPVAAPVTPLSSVPNSPLPQPHSPASLFNHSSLPPVLVTPSSYNLIVPILEAAVLQRRSDIDHSLCKQAQELEAAIVEQLEKQDNDSASPRPKRARSSVTMSVDQLERVLRLQMDLARYCHQSTDAAATSCVLSGEEHKTRLLSVFTKYMHQIRRCKICNQRANWTKPLCVCLRPHQSDRDRDNNESYRFHLECAKYAPNVPFSTQLLCPDCLKEIADNRPLSVEILRRQHAWEHTRAASELYQQGFRICDTPDDGICFFTVLYGIAMQSSRQVDADTVLAWVMGRPYELLLAATSVSDAPAPMKEARADLESWATRSKAQWRSRWNSRALDAVCSMLPNLLENAKLLPTRYYRYGYDSGQNMGRWYSSEGPLLPELHLPAGVKFAVLRYETPIEHYALLERS